MYMNYQSGTIHLAMEPRGGNDMSLGTVDYLSLSLSWKNKSQHEVCLI
jgi:hypothetical protein